MPKSKITPTPGRIVLFTPEPGTPEANNRAAVVPAIVVRAWGGEQDLCNLKVFCDGPDNSWLGSVSFDPDGAPRTWRWCMDKDNQPDLLATAAAKVE